MTVGGRTDQSVLALQPQLCVRHISCYVPADVSGVRHDVLTVRRRLALEFFRLQLPILSEGSTRLPSYCHLGARGSVKPDPARGSPRAAPRGPAVRT